MRALAALLAILIVIGVTGGVAVAQTELRKSPLGVGPAPASAPAAVTAPQAQDRGVLGWATDWLLQVQHDLHRRLAGAVRAIGADKPLNATLFLMALSFAYGIFHAAGPGHGKAVIASYVLANERTVRRGIQLSFLAALIQALSALVLVGLLGLVFNVTGMKRRIAESWLETASWGLVAVMGAWLLYGQIRRIWRVRTVSAHPVPAAHEHAHHDGGHHGHAGHHHDHDHHHHHAHGHGHDDCCDHAHLPAPDQLEGAWSWRKALGMAFAIGIRPCTGAIVVLVFAISQGLLWAGVLSTLAMAVGTAITVSALAALAVGSRELAARIAGPGYSPRAEQVRMVAGFLGATAVFAMGTLFCIASFYAQQPF